METNTIVNYGTDHTISPGYWTFEDLTSFFKGIDVTLSLNPHDSTCSVYGEDHPVKLGNLDPLLGFPLSTTIPANTKTTSPNTGSTST